MYTDLPVSLYYSRKSLARTLQESVLHQGIISNTPECTCADVEVSQPLGDMLFLYASTEWLWRPLTPTKYENHTETKKLNL